MLARSGVGKARRVAARNEVWFQSRALGLSRLQTEFDKLKQKAVSKVRGGPQCARGRARSSLIARARVPFRAAPVGLFVCVLATTE